MNRDNDKGKVLISRSLILGVGKLVLLLVIIARLYYLQVYQADKYKMLADENRISTRLLVPPRGIIYDRHMKELATNRQNFQASIVAEQTTNVQETLDAFKKIMPLSEAEEEKIKKETQPKGIGTKSQQALQQQRELHKTERKETQKEKKKILEQKYFEQKQQKKKQKRKGH